MSRRSEQRALKGWARLAATVLGVVAIWGPGVAHAQLPTVTRGHRRIGVGGWSDTGTFTITRSGSTAAQLSVFFTDESIREPLAGVADVIKGDPKTLRGALRCPDATR